jgi:pimeloyl-ACP methyl ester carboxylesterase
MSSSLQLLRDFCGLEIIYHCGHMPPVEEPEQFNQIVRRFLLMGRDPQTGQAL